MFRNRTRPLSQMLALAVAKAVAVTATLLAGHVTLSVATDLYGFASPEPQQESPAVVEVDEVVTGHTTARP